MPPKPKNVPTLSQNDLIDIELELRRRQNDYETLMRSFQLDPLGYCEHFFKGEIYAPDIQNAMRSVAENPYTGICSANATGKCVGADETIWLADGTPVRAGDLINAEFDVWSVNSDLRRKVSRAYGDDNGVKPCVKIKTHTGKVIVRTDNHPLVGRERGTGKRVWRKAEEFFEGDSILCVSDLPPYSANGSSTIEPEYTPFAKANGGLPKGFAWERVKSIEYAGRIPTVAIGVPGDETFLTQFVEHNTHVFGRIIKWFLDTHSVDGECEVYVTAAPPAANLRNVWGHLQMLQIKYPKLFPSRVMEDVYYVNPKHILEGSEARGKWFAKTVPIPDQASPEKRKESFTGKHAPYMLFIMDEANSIDEPIWGAIEECLRGAIVGRVVFAFNPRTREGAAFNRWQNGGCNPIQISALTHPNVRTGRIVIPGAVARTDVVKATAAWTIPLPEGQEYDEETCFMLPDFLVGKSAVLNNGEMSEPLTPGARLIVNTDYAYSILGRPPKVGVNSLIHPDWIASARARYDQWVSEFGDNPPEAVRPVMGMDVATESLKSDNNPVCGRWGGYIKFETWGSTELPDTERRVAEIYRNWKARTVFVDGTGVGAGVAAHLTEKGVNAVKILSESKPTGIALEFTNGGRSEGHFDKLYDQLLWAIREWLNPLNNQDAMLPPNERLIDALYKLTYRKHSLNGKIQVGRIVREKQGDGTPLPKTTLKMTLGYSPDELWALALTFAPDGGSWVQAYWRD